MIEQVDSPAPIVRFSVFELEPQSGELRKSGMRIALQDHSCRILVRLLESPGQVVTREELRGLLWPADTFVDFERGLNTAIKRLRDALGDVADTPRFIETLPRRGYRFIAPVERIASRAERAVSAGAGPPQRRPRRAATLALILAAVALTATVMLLDSRRPGADPAGAPIVHLLTTVAPAEQLLSAEVMDRSPDVGFGRPSRTAIAISPDGRQLVFSARRGDSQMLYLRGLDQPEATPVPGTEGADSPFFSPDGRWLGFWADGRIRRMRTDGGPVITIADLAPPPRAPSEFAGTDPPLFGASWGADDRIVFSLERGGLWEVSATGGAPAPLTTLQREEASHRLPHVLPGGHAVLFTTKTRVFGDWRATRIEAFVRATGERKLLVEGGADARYVPTGHVLYVRNGTLIAVPFDASRLEVTGEPVGMIDGVLQAVSATNSRIETDAAQFAVSSTGTLAYVAGGEYPRVTSQIVWVDRRGRIEPVRAGARIDGQNPQLSPDGRRIALVACPDPAQACPDLWTYDLARHQLTRLTFGAAASWPVWTPDGQRIAFSSDLRGATGVFWIPADGTEPRAPEPLTDTEDNAIAAAWSAAGDTLVFARRAGNRQYDIWTLSPRTGIAEARLIVATDFDENNPALSPDGRWLAYVSTESGKPDVYVVSFPGRERKHRITSTGGGDPIWSRDGRELYYIAGWPGNLKMMAVPIRTHPELTFGTATALFDIGAQVGRRIQLTTPALGHHIGPDGRFLMTLIDDPPSSRPITQFHVVLNWHTELLAKVPPRR